MIVLMHHIVLLCVSETNKQVNFIFVPREGIVPSLLMDIFSNIYKMKIWKPYKSLNDLRDQMHFVLRRVPNVCAAAGTGIEPPRPSINRHLVLSYNRVTAENFHCYKLIA